MPWLVSPSPSFFSFTEKGFLLGPEDTRVRRGLIKASRNNDEMRDAVGASHSTWMSRACTEHQTIESITENSLIFFLCQKIDISLCRLFPFFLARAADAWKTVQNHRLWGNVEIKENKTQHSEAAIRTDDLKINRRASKMAEQVQLPATMPEDWNSSSWKKMDLQKLFSNLHNTHHGTLMSPTPIPPLHTHREWRHKC